GKDDWRIIHLGEAKYPPRLKSTRLAGIGQNLGQNIGQNIGVPAGQDPNAAAQNQDPNANPNPGQSPSGQAGIQPAGAVGGVGFTGTSTTGTGLGQVGQAGAPIIGVAIPLKRDSLKVYNQREKYDEWEFLYDPRIEAFNNANAVGIPAGPPPTPGNTGAPGVANPITTPQPQPIMPQTQPQ
ncbi:MAG: hypothetical protein JOZ43_03330, partial [Acidobacteriales bacterium]|nr:hypothetical protein [Terriglobales bacterium]